MRRGTLKLGLATLARGLALPQLIVLGVVAGVGFAMALFIGQLAFADGRLLAAATLVEVGANTVRNSWLGVCEESQMITSTG